MKTPGGKQKGKFKKSAKKDGTEQMAKTTKAGFAFNLDEASNMS